MKIPQFESDSPQFKWQNQSWEWLPNRCLLHLDSNSLFLADFHIGKPDCFQRAGINLPKSNSQNQIEGFFDFIQTTNIKQVCILGDLLHGPTTTETNLFLQLLKPLKNIRFHWILGNHDRRSAPVFGPDIAHLKPAKDALWNGIRLCHEPYNDADMPSICGHIHPGLRLPLGAKQSFRAACGMVSENQLILPAFGSLTGLQIQTPEPRTKYYVFTNNQVLKFSFK